MLNVGLVLTWELDMNLELTLFHMYGNMAFINTPN